MSNYDHYADQLLNSVFENAKQTTAPSSPRIQQSAEDQFFNQLLAGMSSPAPFNNANNEWILLQQLQQQKQLLERQQLLSALSPTLSGLTLSQPNTSNDAVTADMPSSPRLTELYSPAVAVTDEKVKKIARVPVQAQSPAPISPIMSKPNGKENDMPIDALVKATTAAALSHHATPKSKALIDAKKPALQKKKSFLRRTWSRRDFKGRETVPPPPPPPPPQQQQQQQNQQQQGNILTRKKSNSVKPVSNQPQQIAGESSFWKPRGEKPKGWWKGNRDDKSNQPQQEYYEEEIEYEEEIPDSQEEDSEEGEEEQPVMVPSSSRRTKKVVVKRVVVPKKVPSISKPKRPMAFKTPTPRKPKTKSSKKKKNEAAVSKNSINATPRKTAAGGMPMYVMPQQPMYYPQPMMMPPAPQPYMMGGGGGGGYCMVSPNGMMGQSLMMQPQYEETEVEEQRPTNFIRKKSVYNPRETSNDKCTIM